VVPNLRPWILNYRLRSATRDTTSNLRVAQMSAVSNFLNYQVFFDTGAGTYKLQRNSGGLWVDEGTAQTLPNGISIATDFGSALTFSPNSSSNGGSIQLSNAKNTRQIYCLAIHRKNNYPMNRSKGLYQSYRRCRLPKSIPGIIREL
jgi:Tfp pilus assembly protein FimT